MSSVSHPTIAAMQMQAGIGTYFVVKSVKIDEMYKYTYEIQQSCRHQTMQLMYSEQEIIKNKTPIDI